METKTKQKHIQILFYLSLIVLLIGFITTLTLSITNLNPHKAIVILEPETPIKTVPKKSGKTLEKLEQGQVLTALNQKRNWYKVKDSKNRTGWVNIKQTNQGAPLPGTKKEGVIIQNKVPLTLKPKHESNVVEQLKRGEKIIITTELAGWSQIATKGVEGWVPSDAIRVKKTLLSPNDVENKVYTRQKGTTLRKEPKQTGKPLSTVAFGEKLTYITQVDDWYKVLTEKKDVAYVQNWAVNFSKPNQKDPYHISPLADKTVLLDPGHGGEDSGAISINGNVYEKTVTLATANYVKKELEEAGANVLMTRSDDSFVDLNLINEQEKNALIDTFISFHYDSSTNNNEATGFTTYYYHGNDQLLAEAVNTELEKNLSLPNRGVEAGDFQVIRESKTTSILLELGYMNTDTDLQTFITKDYQQGVANGVRDGLMTYYEAH